VLSDWRFPGGGSNLFRVVRWNYRKTNFTFHTGIFDMTCWHHESQDDWKVCCEAVDGSEAVEKYGPANPQLTVMDFNMPGLDGLKASREILTKNPNAPILMVTVFNSSQLAEEAKRAGIKGFCSKIHIDCITEAIRALLQGRTYFTDAG
jgi:DNA-binding NarL/FixJ family response regulator